MTSDGNAQTRKFGLGKNTFGWEGKSDHRGEANSVVHLEKSA